MAIGTILVNGKEGGLGFALATKQDDEERVVALTANHVTCDLKDQPHDKSALKFKLHTTGREIPVDDVKRDEGGDLDVAILYLRENVPGALTVSEAVEEEAWVLQAAPFSTDPYLRGTVDFTQRSYKNHKGHQTTVMQLSVQKTGSYKGYSGGPVVQSSTGAVIGVLVEEQFLRLPRSLSSFERPREAVGILYAIPIRKVLERFGLDAVQLRMPRNVSSDFTIPTPSDYLVGRDALLKDLKQRLLEPGQGNVTVLLRTPGVGKTELAAHLANSAEIREKFDHRILWAPLGREPDIKTLLGEWAHAVGISSEDLTELQDPWSRANKIRDELRLNSEHWLLIVDDAWEMEHAAYFLFDGSTCWTVITTRSPAVAKDFDEEAHKTVEPLDFDEGLELLNKVAGLPTGTTDERHDALEELVRAVDALPQALIIVGAYLRKKRRKKRQRVDIGEALKKLQKAELRLALKSPTKLPRRPEDAPRSLWASIKMSEDALDEEALDEEALDEEALDEESQGDDDRRMLRVVSVFRPKPGSFSVPAAAAMCLVDEADEESWEKLYGTLYRLNDAGLLEDANKLQETANVRSGAQRAIDKELQSDRFAMPGTVCDYARTYMEEYGLDAEELHLRAAGYYRFLLNENEEIRRDASPYSRMYSYEDPLWQAAKAAWFYHLSYAGQAHANLQFAGLYLDAFWWWGCYRPFPFCEKLIEEWRERQWRERRTGPEDRRWLRLVNDFHEAYPTGYDKRGKGNWERVERALLELRKLGGFDGDWRALDEERRHVRAISGFFLAESRRYRDPHDTDTDAYYQESLEILEAIVDGNKDHDDAWNLPWARWHLADLYLERGEVEPALRWAEESEREAVALEEDACERDNEVIANDHRVMADARWLEGDVDGAFREYARALFFAYVFQGLPQPPDFYTIDFYREMRERTVGRIRELREGGREEEAERACGYLGEFWRPYWERAEMPGGGVEARELLTEGSWEELEGDLFPPMPMEEEIEEEQRSDYYSQVRMIFEATVGSSQHRGGHYVSEENKALVHRWVEEMCGQRNLSVGDEIFAAEMVDHDPIPGQAAGPEGQKQVLREIFAAFPDFHSQAEEIIAEDDRVMVRWTATGTHQGDYFGAKPTGKRISYRGIDSLRIADGKIVERWGVSDDLDLLQQIEAI